jgi:hypothetical protein
MHKPPHGMRKERNKRKKIICWSPTRKPPDNISARIMIVKDAQVGRVVNEDK